MTDPTTMAAKRYDLITNYRCGSAIEEMEPSEDGEWVRYEDVAAALDALQRGVEQLKAERDEAKAGCEAWQRYARMNRPMTPAEHDPKKHAENCSRFHNEDDRVIAAFCGHVYDPSAVCSCGADLNWKARAEQAEAQLATAQKALKKLHPLIKGVWEEHSDCHAIGYNECDIDECSWCEETRALLKEK